MALLIALFASASPISHVPHRLQAMFDQLTAVADKHGANWATMGGAFQVPEQISALLRLGVPDGERLERVCEIGFNAGHSGAALLFRNNATLHEFDIHKLPYSVPNAATFGRLFEGRFALTKGDSTQTVGPFIDEALRSDVAPPCDRFFIDGGHNNPVVAIDFANAMRGTRAGGLVMADDTTSRFPDVPSEWKKLVKHGYVADSKCEQYAKPQPAGLKGFCVGTRTDKPFVPMARRGHGSRRLQIGIEDASDANMEEKAPSHRIMLPPQKRTRDDPGHRTVLRSPEQVVAPQPTRVSTVGPPPAAGGALMVVNSTDGTTSVAVDEMGRVGAVRGGTGTLLASGGGTNLEGCYADGATVERIPSPPGAVRARRLVRCPELLDSSQCVHLVETWSASSSNPSSVVWSTALGSGPCPPIKGPHATRPYEQSANQVHSRSSRPLLAPSFTTAIHTRLDSAPSLDGYWTAWGKGGTANHCCSDANPWEYPLGVATLKTARYRLGRTSQLGEQAVWDAVGLAANDSITIPMVALLARPPEVPLGNGKPKDGKSQSSRPEVDSGAAAEDSPLWSAESHGLTLTLDPSDTLLEVALGVDPAGASLSRHLLRIRPGLQRRFTATLTAHRASPRASMHHVLTSYPRFFYAPNRNVSRLEGLGAYSWRLHELNRTWSHKMGMTTNWDLSGTWMPYDGLFLPYTHNWTSLGKEKPGYTVSDADIADAYAAVHAQGLHTLSYFDIGNWGVDVSLGSPHDLAAATDGRECGVRRSGEPAPCWGAHGDPGLQSSAYLWEHLMPSLLARAWSGDAGFVYGPVGDWVGTTLMDPGDKGFQDLLLEQAALHATRVPSFEGLAIDRFDYPEYFNLDADDGISWVPHPNRNISDVKDSSDGSDQRHVQYGPARSLRISYRETLRRLSSEVIHKSGSDRFLGCNAAEFGRIDLLEACDLTFNEIWALNAVAWIGLGDKPTLLWTYSLAGYGTDQLHAYFQQHLLMHVYPSAPMPGNNHMIEPGNRTVDLFYESYAPRYAPLFAAVRGAHWHLSPVADAVTLVPLGPARIAGGRRAVANEFVRASDAMAPHQGSRKQASLALLAPIMLGISLERIGVQLRFGASLGAVRGDELFDAFSLAPGSTAWKRLGRLQPHAGRAELNVTLSEAGCLLLRVELAAMGDRRWA